MATTKAVKQHSTAKLGGTGIAVDNASVLLIGHLSNDTYSSSWNGETFSIEISERTLQTLFDTMRGLYGAYRTFILNPDEVFADISGL